jgi:hypothetical protein
VARSLSEVGMVLSLEQLNGDTSQKLNLKNIENTKMLNLYYHDPLMREIERLSSISQKVNKHPTCNRASQLPSSKVIKSCDNQSLAKVAAVYLFFLYG